MSGPRRLILSASYFQSISASSRHQLRTRRRPIQFSIVSRIQANSRSFTSIARWRADGKKTSNIDDGSVTLPEETSTIARAADEPPKLADLEEISEGATPTELAEGIEKPKVDDGAATLPEETTTIARSADEPPKPSDLDAIPEDLPATKLAEAIEEARLEEGDSAEPTDIETIEANAQQGGAEATEDGISRYFDDGEGKVKQNSKHRPNSSDTDTATILKHGESETHQDLREYARLAAWELPLLHKLRQPFTPPTSSTPLRFRYTSYMGDEHPASRKVVVEFKPAELPGLTEKQQIKLIKLVGTRYNPEKQMIKMSCESFETPAQNKRYLGDLVQKLVAEAKDGKDTLEDIPVDLRHHKQKKKYTFPEEWKIQRPKRIEDGKGLRGKGREKRALLAQLQEEGKLVNGTKVIQEALAALPVRSLARPGDGDKTVLGTRTGKAPVRKRGAPGAAGW